MLVQRIITAIILAVVAIAAIFTLPPLLFDLFIAIIVLFAAWEWADLSDISTIVGKMLLLLGLIIPMLFVTFWTQILQIVSDLTQNLEIRNYSGVLEWLVIPPVIFWLMMTIFIKKMPDVILRLEIKKRYKILTGWFVLVSAWMFLCRLKIYYGPEAILYFLLLIWAADISAYFAGKKFGKDKMAPLISPGKTVQGMYGAIISAFVCAIFLALYYHYPFMIATDFGLLSILTVIVSIYGDLFFSLIKRQKGVKDSGSLLPGHGGVLDRIDSVIAAAPFYYAGVVLIGRSVYS